MPNNSDAAPSTPVRPKHARTASESSPSSIPLAKLYSPPTKSISPLKWTDALQVGKEKKKWILINIQDREIFSCQILNRELWRNREIMAAVADHFIFLQFFKEDRRVWAYIRRYLPTDCEKHDDYPHIAVVDPRTGEQLQIWSGKVPKPMDFLADLNEFEFMWDDNNETMEE